MTYSVRLDAFEGPLDLLLHLVSRERVDVAEISISAITDEFLRSIDPLREIDLDAASGFLVLAATLLELKSLKLLPRRVAVDPEVAALLEERDRLLHRLVGYSTFKGAADFMAGALRANEGYFTRDSGVPEEFVPAIPDVMEGVTPQMLAKAAVRALAPRERTPVDTSHMGPVRISVREVVRQLDRLLREAGVASFRDLCRGSERIEFVVRFLALLELVKGDYVDVEQQSPFSDIVVRYRRPIGRDRPEPADTVGIEDADVQAP
jgi:segregation and condensation protein A